LPQAANLTPLHVYNVGLTYYVSPSGNDSTGDGSIGNPWKTLQKAHDYLRFTANWPANQDIRVYARGGVYQAAAATVATLDINFDQVGRLPTSTQRIIWQSYPGEQAVIKPPSGLTGAKYGIRTTSITGFSADYQIFRQLEVDGEQIIKGDGDVTGIYLSNQTTQNEIVDCVVHGLRANYVANGGGAARKAQGIFIEQGAVNNRVWNPHVYDIGDTAGTIASQEHAMYLQSDGIQVVNVKIHDIPNGFGVQFYDSGNPHTGQILTNGTIAGNIHKACIIVHPDNTNSHITNMILKGATEEGIQFYPTSGGTGSGNTIDHVVYNGNTGGDRGGVGGPAPTGWAITNEKDADPLLTDYAGRDFHLQPTSPAIAYTDTNFAPATDIEGTTRPAGSEDAGAYQHAAGGGGGGSFSPAVLGGSFHNS